MKIKSNYVVTVRNGKRKVSTAGAYRAKRIALKLGGIILVIAAMILLTGAASTMGDPDEVAATIFFLALCCALLITGIVCGIKGGEDDE